MTKIQKIWLGVSAAMFLVPEVLWSPVGNLIYSLFAPTLNGNYQILRNSFLFDYKYENLLKIVLFLQLTGTMLFFFVWLKFRKDISSRLLFWTILVVSFLLSLVSMFTFYLGTVFSISF